VIAGTGFHQADAIASIVIALLILVPAPSVEDHRGAERAIRGGDGSI